MDACVLVNSHGILPLVALQNSWVVSVAAGVKVPMFAEDTHPPPIICHYSLPNWGV